MNKLIIEIDKLENKARSELHKSEKDFDKGYYLGLAHGYKFAKNLIKGQSNEQGI